MSVYKKQIGGSHYKDMKIQPSKFINDNKLLFAEGNAIIYICRHAHKGEVLDLEKAEQLPLSFEYKVVHNPTDEDLDTGEFSATIGDILLNIIDESIENEQLQFKNRNDDIK